MIEKKTYWEKSGGNDLLKSQTFQDVFNRPEIREKVFNLTDRDLRCIDEGTPGGLHLAGEGILYTKAKEDLKGEVEGVYSHEGCGGAALFAQRGNIKIENPDELCDRWSKELAESLGVVYKGRIPAEEMSRPKEFHVARAIYYDGTGRLDNSKVLGLPSGFVISRKLISDPNYAKEEVGLAIEIALGGHSFGEFFRPHSPLYLVAVTSDDLDSISVEELRRELKERAERKENVVVESVVVKG